MVNCVGNCYKISFQYTFNCLPLFRLLCFKNLKWICANYTTRYAHSIFIHHQIRKVLSRYSRKHLFFVLFCASTQPWSSANFYGIAWEASSSKSYLPFLKVWKIDSVANCGSCSKRCYHQTLLLLFQWCLWKTGRHSKASSRFV